MLQPITNTSKTVWGVCNLKTLVQIHIEIRELTLKMIHFWRCYSKITAALLQDYDVIWVQCTSLRRPLKLTIKFIHYKWLHIFIMNRLCWSEWVLVDQRVAGYVTRSKTTRVLWSIPWKEFNKMFMHFVDSMAQWLRASWLLRSWLQSWWLTPTQVSLLRPWIRYFLIITSAWWNLTSSKLKKSEAKVN